MPPTGALRAQEAESTTHAGFVETVEASITGKVLAIYEEQPDVYSIGKVIAVEQLSTLTLKAGEACVSAPPCVAT